MRRQQIGVINFPQLAEFLSGEGFDVIGNDNFKESGTRLSQMSKEMPIPTIFGEQGSLPNGAVTLAMKLAQSSQVTVVNLAGSQGVLSEVCTTSLDAPVSVSEVLLSLRISTPVTAEIAPSGEVSSFVTPSVSAGDKTFINVEGNNVEALVAFVQDDVVHLSFIHPITGAVAIEQRLVSDLEPNEPIEPVEVFPWELDDDDDDDAPSTEAKVSTVTVPASPQTPSTPANDVPQQSGIGFPVSDAPINGLQSPEPSSADSAPLDESEETIPPWKKVPPRDKRDDHNGPGTEHLSPSNPGWKTLPRRTDPNVASQPKNPWEMPVEDEVAWKSPQGQNPTSPQPEKEKTPPPESRMETQPEPQSMWNGMQPTSPMIPREPTPTTHSLWERGTQDDTPPASAVVNTQVSVPPTSGLAPRSSLGSQILFVFSAKGGVAKSATSRHLAQRASLAGFKTILIDGNRGQGDQRTTLRLASAGFPSVYDAAVTSDPKSSLIPPAEINRARGKLLDRVGFGLALAPPPELDDLELVTPQAYREVIAAAAEQQADLVIVDLQMFEAAAVRTEGQMAHDLVVPLMKEGAFGLGLSENSTESMWNLYYIFEELRRWDVPASRLLSALTMLQERDTFDDKAAETRLESASRFLGRFYRNLEVSDLIAAGVIPQDHPSLSQFYDSILDAVLPGFAAQSPPPKKKRRWFGRR